MEKEQEERENASQQYVIRTRKAMEVAKKK
jgi:hypothetical protein